MKTRGAIQCFLLAVVLAATPIVEAAGLPPSDQKQKLTEANLRNLQEWCNDTFVGLPQVVYLPESLPDGRTGLLTVAEVVSAYPSMPEESQARVIELLQTFDEKRMVFHSHINAGPDIIGQLGEMEAALNLDTGVTALVSYPWLQEKFGLKTFGLPPFMDKFVTELTQQLIAGLSRRQQTLVRQFTLTFKDVPYRSGLLWLGTDRAQRSITVSPLFIRTVFIAATSEGRSPCSQYVTRLSKLYKDRERTVADVSDILNRYLEKFRAGIAFPIAHELAHAYLPFDHASDEHECDVAAINNLRSAKMPLDLGAFQTILVRSIQEGREDLWGIEPSVQATGVIQRLCRLKREFPSLSADEAVCAAVQ